MKIIQETSILLRLDIQNNIEQYIQYLGFCDQGKDENGALLNYLYLVFEGKQGTVMMIFCPIEQFIQQKSIFNC